MKLKNKMLQQNNDELQSSLDTGNKQLNKTLVKKYRELKDEKQPDTTVKDAVVCTYRIIAQ